MGPLNSNQEGIRLNQLDRNLGFRMEVQPGAEDSTNQQLGPKSNGTDTETELDAGLLPKPRTELRSIGDEDMNLDMETDSQSPFDVNLYQHKKTLAQGMMDLALFSANANQLRYVLELPEESRRIFFYMSLTLILCSLCLQLIVGIGLIWHGQFNIKKSCDHHNANRTNNLTLIGIFLITIINVFISAFGIPSGGQATTTTLTNRNAEE